MNLGIEYDSKAINPMLLELVKKNRGPTRYTTCEIAREHGHLVMFTPPYHPQLQPKLIWGMVKNRIARDPASNMRDLEKKVREGLAAIQGSDWCAVYRHSQVAEDKYFELSTN